MDYSCPNDERFEVNRATHPFTFSLPMLDISHWLWHSLTMQPANQSQHGTSDHYYQSNLAFTLPELAFLV